MTSAEAYARELDAFRSNQRILKELRKELATPVPVVRKAIRSRAMDTLPKGGGLNKWVAAVSIRFKRQTIGKSVRVRITAGRNSSGGRSDIKRIDGGTTRSPSWGRRGKGQWHLTKVTPGFFSIPTSDEQPWLQAADRALDKALNDIR